MSVRVKRPQYCLLALLGFATLATDAWAQRATAPIPPGETYVDRVIENLPPEPREDGDAYPYEREGMPRFLRLETRLGTQPFDQTQSTRIGYGIYGLLETLNHGTLDVFIHPNTGDELSDHRDGALWLGKSYTLDLSVLS